MFAAGESSAPLFVSAALWSARCGGLTFHKVRGVITLNGKPVEYAEMHIHPTSDQPNRGRTVHVRIVNGRYDTREIGGVPGGPAEWTIAVAEPGTMRIKDPDNVSSEESEQFLHAKKQVFTKQIEVNQEEINVELP